MSVFNGVILKYILKNSIKMTPTVRTLLLGRKMLSVIMFLSSPRWPLTLSLIIYRWRLDIKLHSDINLMAQMCSDSKNLGAHFRSPHPLSHCSIIAVMRLSMFPVCCSGLTVAEAAPMWKDWGLLRTKTYGCALQPNGRCRVVPCWRVKRTSTCLSLSSCQYLPQTD